MKTKFKIVNAKLKKLTNNKRKNLNPQKNNTWIYIIICIFFIRTILTPYTNLLKIVYDTIQITYIFAIIVLTKKTANIEEKQANIEEKQFQLLTNKKANVIIRHNVNFLEEMILEGKMKAPIKIDISNCGNDTATNIAISINKIEIPQISFLLPNEIKSVYIGMVDISNHKITLVTGHEFPIEKSNTLHMNIQEIKNANNKWMIPIIITTDNK
jgi:hypothetical protein